MFGIETTTGTKFQIGFVLLILGVAGFMLLRNSKKPVNDAVNAWKEPHQYYLAGGTNRQMDPKKAEIWNVFACVDGKLIIKEFTGDPTKAAFIMWDVDTRRAPDYTYYHDPLARAAKIKDPYKHAITLAAFSAADGRSLGFMGTANLTTEQKAQEQVARKTMTDELDYIRSREEDGTFHSDMYKKVLSDLAAYQKIDGDPMKDAKKAAAARTVIQSAADYLNKVEDERAASIDKYINFVTGMLTQPQKTEVATAGKNYEQRLVPKMTTQSSAPAPRGAGRGATSRPRGTPAAPGRAGAAG